MVYNIDNNFESRKPTEYEIEMYISNTLQDNCTFVRLRNEPRIWRHACVAQGVAELKSYDLYINGIRLKYAFCRSCKEVIYYMF